MSVFDKLKLRQISSNFKISCCNLKVRGLGAKVCVAFNFEKNYGISNSKSSCFLLNKNINFNKKEMEWKMENPPYTF